MYLVLVAVVVVGIMTVLYAQVRAAEQDRDEWKAVADVAVALLRRGDYSDAELPSVCRAVSAYNAMLEPEG